MQFFGKVPRTEECFRKLANVLNVFSKIFLQVPELSGSNDTILSEVSSVGGCSLNGLDIAIAPTSGQP